MQAPQLLGVVHVTKIPQFSCQGEVHSINEITKLILEYDLLFRDLNIPLHHPVEIKNDNPKVPRQRKYAVPTYKKILFGKIFSTRQSKAAIFSAKLICVTSSPKNFVTSINSYFSVICL